jgi:glycine betaine/proline transport system substrate-binding protein
VVGIDPGAGIMEKTREALEAYGIAHRFQLVAGSEREMTEALSRAIRRQEWFVVTGWQPHWMFGDWKLRFLDDPKGVFGGPGTINTVVRKGLKEDRPEVVAVLDRFRWTVDDMDQLVSWNHDTGTGHAYENAIRWMAEHEDQVAAWLSAGE